MLWGALMSINVLFPNNAKFHYYALHVAYVLNLFKYAPDVCVKLDDIPFDLGDVAFHCFINDKKVIFCFADDPYKFSADDISPLNHIHDIPIFKFHYAADASFSSNVIPFAPISFYDWDEYTALSEKIVYKAKGKINYIQRAYGNARERRKKVLSLLKNEYGDELYTVLLNQKFYWLRIASILTSVFVPGYCNNMIDRGIFQSMFLGCCCITSSIPEKLPWDLSLIPGEDYVLCADDYSDLIEKINWVSAHRIEAVEIGRKVKEKCATYFNPESLVKWIMLNA